MDGVWSRRTFPLAFVLIIQTHTHTDMHIHAHTQTCKHTNTHIHVHTIARAACREESMPRGVPRPLLFISLSFSSQLKRSMETSTLSRHCFSHCREKMIQLTHTHTHTHKAHKYILLLLLLAAGQIRTLSDLVLTLLKKYRADSISRDE